MKPVPLFKPHAQMCVSATMMKADTTNGRLQWNFGFHACFCLTCIQFPPVNLTEERVRPQLVARVVLEAEPLVDLFAQQTLTDGPGVLAKLLRISYRIIQNPLLHHLILHL